MPSQEFYQQRAQQFAKQREQVEKVIRQYAWSRVALMAIIGLLVYLGFTNSIFFALILIPLAIFIFLINKQTAQEERKKLLTYLEELNRSEAKGLSFEPTDFSDGIRFADPHHPYSYDLDLFGSGSLYQYINRCGTELGEDRLARDLKALNYSRDELGERQAAVHELGTQLEFRQHVWALGRQLRAFTFDQTFLRSWLSEKPLIYGKSGYTTLRWVSPAITLLIAGLAIYDVSYFTLLFVAMIIQIAIAGIQAKKIGDLQRGLSKGKDSLANYARIFELLTQQKYETPLMKKHLQTANEAFEKVAQFSKLVNALESRMNPFAMMFGNGLFLYDFHAVSRVEAWREANAQQLPGWLESLAEWDALISLATIHYNNPSYTFAEYSEGNRLRGKAIGHPLISNKERVTNDFEIGSPATVWLITGANMAGKSTFLRTLGVNFVLGGMGSPVCASIWTMPLIALRTGMRTSDSLQDHQSYFYAELHRLQSIMEELRAGKPMVILLDEILKGTNSTDKQAGSRELIKQLKGLQALVVLATHDIALGDLEEQHPNQIANGCFEGKIENDQLTFDYTLHTGVAQKANATFLMRKMGIIPNE
jgi:ABC-type multidrug transport system fused ATPase/permease subunit